MRKPVLHVLTCVALAGILAAGPAAGARESDSDDDNGNSPLFARHTPLQVKIEAPLTTLMEQRPEEEYLDGTFSYIADDGTEKVFDLKIRTRGNFRRQEKICNFAPVRLNFRKKQVEDTEFTGQDKLKLVTHCQNRKPSFEQLLLREYIAYRILQVMTDRSFGVRLFHITYVDTERGESMTRYGFALEEDDDVADRVGMKPVKTGEISHDDLDPRQENLVNVYQYLIGNTDFSLVKGPEIDDCCHNSILLSATGGPPFTPLPYDFDFAGLVNAPYAGTNPRFKLRSVRQRLFRGQCKNNELLPDTFRQFVNKKPAIYAIVAELDMLTPRTARDVTRYLDSFFAHITDPKSIQTYFIDKCNVPA